MHSGHTVLSDEFERSKQDTALFSLTLPWTNFEP